MFYNLQRTGTSRVMFRRAGCSAYVFLGLYKTHVTNEGTPILGSPFDTLIEPGLVDVAQCTAAGKVSIGSKRKGTLVYYLTGLG